MKYKTFSGGHMVLTPAAEKIYRFLKDCLIYGRVANASEMSLETDSV